MGFSLHTVAVSKLTQKLTLLSLRGLRKLGILRRLNLRWRSRTRGLPQVIPLLGGVGIEHFYDYEPWMPSLLSSLGLGPGQTFLDIGVNLGQTLLSFKSVYPDLPYVGFEPNPLCVSYTRELTLANSFGDVRLYPAGIGERASVGMLDVFDESDVGASASVILGFRPDSGRQQPVCLLGFTEVDPVLSTLDVGAIKIDVEGAELEVLKTLLPLLRKQRPPVLLEVLPTYDGQEQSRVHRQRDLGDLLSLANYKIFRVLKGQRNEFKGLEGLAEFDHHRRMDWCDYVCRYSEAER